MSGQAATQAPAMVLLMAGAGAGGGQATLVLGHVIGMESGGRGGSGHCRRRNSGYHAYEEAEKSVEGEGTEEADVTIGCVQHSAARCSAVQRDTRGCPAGIKRRM